MVKVVGIEGNKIKLFEKSGPSREESRSRTAVGKRKRGQTTLARN
jgi:hypothetical protein